LTGPRTYGSPCGLALALDAIGERWALLVVRELLYGPRRFTDLRATLGASANVLSQRLDELLEAGVIARRTVGGAQYELTDRGRELHPVLVALALWGLAAPAPAGDPGTAAILLALEARLDGSPIAGSCDLRLGDEAFTLTFRDGSLAIVRARSPVPDAVIETTADALRALVFDRADPGPALTLRGDTRLGAAIVHALRAH
jgi:DNA-binding HxlR family transcriptional regulator